MLWPNTTRVSYKTGLDSLRNLMRELSGDVFNRDFVEQKGGRLIIGDVIWLDGIPWVSIKSKGPLLFLGLGTLPLWLLMFSRSPG